VEDAGKVTSKQSTKAFVRWKRWLKLIVPAVLALLSGLLVIEDKAKGLFSKKIFLYAYVALDLFRWELAGLLLGVLLYPFLAPRLMAAVAALRLFVRHRAAVIAYRWRLFRLVGLIFGLLLVGWYQVNKLFLGKKVHFQNYATILEGRANRAFLEGKIQSAQLHLHVCEEVFHACPNSLGILDHRLQKAKILREIQAAAPLQALSKRQLLVEIFALDADRKYYESALAKHIQFQQSIRRQYVEALRAIEHNDGAKARDLLQEVQERFPGYGDCHILLRELGRSQQGGAQTPYLLALKRLGLSDFVSRVADDRDQRYLQALQEGDQLLDAGGFVY
jgi:hypothetical protein